MIKFGIYSPGWMLAKHNTDYKITRMFSRLSEYIDCKASFVASNMYTQSFNVNKIIQKLINPEAQYIKHGLRKPEQEIDFIYHYGNPVKPLSFFKAVDQWPVLVTTGFMTDRYMVDSLGKLNNRQKEADQLAKMLEHVSLIHFHTESGRQRFLSYRPDFKEKSVSIPFFLPNLEQFEVTKTVSDEQVNILFVGNEGHRKGLRELIEALDVLGSTYLNERNVQVTVVSKDKPMPKTNVRIKWHKQITHEHVIRLMQEASIFVLVPKRESYGLVLIEAMVAGCAIISDDDETRQEILGDAGILLSSQTPGQIARTLKVLIEDKLYRNKLGDKALARARTKFFPGLVSWQYETCFRSVIKR